MRLIVMVTLSAYNIGYNMGLNAGASIEHLHMHIIPRYPREIGIVELIGGSRVLVQDPKDTLAQLSSIFNELAVLHEPNISTERQDR